MASSTLSKALILSSAVSSPLPPQQRQPSQLLFTGSWQCSRRFDQPSLTLFRSSAHKEGEVLGAVEKNASDVKNIVVDKSQEAADKGKEYQDAAAKKLEETGDAAAEKVKEGKDLVAEKADEAGHKAGELKDAAVEKAKETKSFVDEKAKEGNDIAGAKISELAGSVEDAAKKAKDALSG